MEPEAEAQNAETNGGVGSGDDDGFVPVPLPDSGGEAGVGVENSQQAAQDTAILVLSKDPPPKSQPIVSRGQASEMPPPAMGRDYGAMQVDDLIASDAEDAAGSEWEAELELAGGQAQELAAAPAEPEEASARGKRASSAAKDRNIRYELHRVATRTVESG